MSDDETILEAVEPVRCDTCGAGPYWPEDGETRVPTCAACPAVVGAAVPVRRVVVTGAELVAGLAATFERRGGTMLGAAWSQAATELQELVGRMERDARSVDDAAVLVDGLAQTSGEGDARVQLAALLLLDVADEASRNAEGGRDDAKGERVAGALLAAYMHETERE